jgi:hypothetical protein
MIVLIVLILAAAGVAITALVTRGTGTAPLKSSVHTYSTGESNAGWPSYNLFAGNCSSYVATYQYSWMGLMSAPTPITVPAGGLVQLGGHQATDTTITVTAAPSTISFPSGLPYPQPDQVGVFVAGHDSLISYRCG